MDNANVLIIGVETKDLDILVVVDKGNTLIAEYRLTEKIKSYDALMAKHRD